MELDQYLEIFIEESKEHLQSCNEQLLQLEKQPTDLSIVNEIFRSAHTLKGMAATMGFEDLASLTHKMENVLDAIRNNKLQVDAAVLDVVFLAVDDLEYMIESIAGGNDGKKDVSEVIRKLSAVENGETIIQHANEEVASTAVIEDAFTFNEYEQTIIEQSNQQGFKCLEIKVSLRQDCMLKAVRAFMVFEKLEGIGEIIKSNPESSDLENEQFDLSFQLALLTKDTSEKIEQLILQVSEIDSVSVNEVSIDKQPVKEETNQAVVVSTADHDNAVVTSPTETKKKNQANKTIRVSIERLDTLMNLFEELVIDKGRLEQISQQIGNNDLTETVERMTRISGDLQNLILNMRMVPIENVFNRFPRMVRQLARDLNKKIDLQIVGAETELDRTVIDEIGDPLVHLLRNALDHGVERPEVRKENGKSETGTIQLKAYHSGNHVFIEIQDDGAGINREKVLQKAINKNIITPEKAEQLSDKQVYELILASGFSTADTISDISGRGVGLDVVKATIESLGGNISIESNEGFGSTFIIQLPLTLTIINSLMVGVGAETYAIPLSSIIESALILKKDIFNTHDQQVIDFRGKIIPLVYLNDIYSLESIEIEDEFISVVIIKKGDKMAALVVDSFVGQQEVVLKSLGNYLNNVPSILGATILGDGEVALIIDCNALIN